MTAQDDDFAALFANSVAKDTRRGRQLRSGERVEGTIVQITNEWVFVDVGARSEARVLRDELTDAAGKLSVGVGDTLRATVSRDEAHGGIELAVTLGRSSVTNAALELALQSGTPVEGTVTGTNKGGLEVDVGDTRAFCPASQVELGPARELSGYVGQTYFFRVLELRDRGRSVVISRRALLQEEREQNIRTLRDRLSVGAEIDGIVQSVQSYGAFVDLGGLEGLVHVSELSDTRVERASDVVSVGEPVRVCVLSVEEGVSGSSKDIRIALSLRSIRQREQPTRVQDIFPGKIVKITASGVLVDTTLGRGLVPVSELGLAPGGDPRRTFTVDQDVRVVMLAREPSGKLRYSIRGVANVEERGNFTTFAQQRSGSASFGSLGDLLRDLVPARAVVPVSAPETPAVTTERKRRRRV